MPSAIDAIDMSLPLFTLAVIMGIMLAEARLSRRHEAELRMLGATTPPGDVYPVMAVLYPVVFIVMGLEGFYRATNREVQLSMIELSPEAWYVSGFVLFIASKGLKYWAIRALGVRWSFRVLVLRGVPLVTSGPYKYVAHPNYIAVMGELLGTAMMMNARVSGPAAVIVFGMTLWARIRFENRILDAETRDVDRS